MNTPTPTCWSTAAFGADADTTPAELSALGEHLQLCGRPRRWAALHCAAAAVHGFVAARFVTTLIVLALAVAAAALVR